jgi:hypothetical protein
VEAKNLGVHINIDSISNLAKFGVSFGNAYPVGIRLVKYNGRWKLENLLIMIKVNSEFLLNKLMK